MTNPESPTAVSRHGQYFGNSGALFVEWTSDLSFFKITTAPTGCELGPEARRQLALQLLAIVLPRE